MKIRKFAVTDVALERSPGQEADIFVGNLVDERQGGPITIGYGRYAPGQSLTETIEVDDVMIVLEGQRSRRTWEQSPPGQARSSTCPRVKR